MAAATDNTLVSPKKNQKGKRKLSVKDENKDLPSKKQHKPDFNAVKFKMMLRDPNTAFTGLERFLKEAQSYPDETDQDIVANYCRASDECADVFQILDGGKRKSSELYVIFQVLEAILIRLADDLCNLESVSRNIIRKILAGHMGSLYFMLSVRNKSSQIKTTLKLLTTMVMQSDVAARDIQAQFDFNHYNIYPLFNRRDTKNPQDVRTCLLHFIMSFLISGDNGVITQLVETKGFLNSIFPGLFSDKIESLQLVLSTFLEKVVQNPAVSKTDKIRLFNNRTLEELSKLYNWQGPGKWHDINKTRGDSFTQPQLKSQTRILNSEIGSLITYLTIQNHFISEEETVLTEDQQTVRQLTHQFLLEVCCPIKTGINFYDKNFATSRKNFNHVLTIFMGSFTAPYLDVLKTELIVRILISCPDQLYWYLPKLKDSLSPRASPAWVKSMHFLKKILTAQPEVSPALDLNQQVPVTKMVSMVMNTIVFPNEIWATVASSIKNDSLVVRHQGLSVVLVVLSRMQQTTLQSDEKMAKQYTTDEIQQFKTLLAEAFCKIMPSLDHIFRCWTKVVHQHKETKTGTAQQQERNEESMETGEQNQGQGHTDLAVDSIEHLCMVLQVLCMYQQLLPDVFGEHPLDFSSLLEGVRGLSNDLPQQKKDILCLHILKLLSESDVRQLAWFKQSTGGRSTLYLLLELIQTTADDVQMSKLTRQLLAKLLIKTGLFDHQTEETTVWLRQLSQMTNRGVISFLEKALSQLLRDPYSHTETINDLMAESATLIGSNIGDDTESVTTCSELLIDTILSMDEVELDEQTDDGQQDIQTDTQTDGQFPFSPLVPAALEVFTSTGRNKTRADKDTQIYLSKVLMEIVRTQTDPLCLSLLLVRHKETLPSQLIHSISVWLPKRLRQNLDAAEPDDVELESDDWESLPTMLQRTFEGSGSKNAKEKLLEGSELIYKEEAVNLVKQILLYLRTDILSIKKEKQINMDVIQLYFDMLHNIVSGLKHNTNMTTPSETAPVYTDKATSSEETEADTDQTASSDTSETSVGKGENDTDKVTSSGTQHLGKEFESLIKQELKETDILKAVVSYVFQHGLIKRLFLWEPDVPAMKEKEKKLFTCLSNLLTPMISNLALQIHSDIDNEILLPYINSICAKLSLQPEDSYDVTPLLESLAGFVHVMNADRLVQIVENLLMLCTVENPETEIFTRLCDISVGCIKQILETRKEAVISLKLSCNAVSHLAKLTMKGDSKFTSDLLLDILKLSSVYSVAIDRDVFVWYLRKLTTPGELQIVQLLLTTSGACRKWFEDWCQTSKALRSRGRMKYLHSICVYLAASLEVEDVVIEIFKEIFFDDLSEWMTTEQEDVEAADVDRVELLLHLITHHADTQCQQEMMERMSAAMQYFVITRHQMAFYNQLVNRVLDATDNADDRETLAQGFVRNCMMAMHSNLTAKGAGDKDVPDKIIHVLTDHWQSKPLNRFPEDISNIWNQFVKSSLKRLYSNTKYLSLLKCFLPVVYQQTSDEQTTSGDLLPLSTLHQMVISHSLFLPTVLQEKHTPEKDAVVDLLLCLVKLDSTSCQTSHVGVLLGAYGASLHKTDQKLLMLMKVYESTDCSLRDYRPYLWGPRAVEHHSIKKSLGASLWKQPSMEQVLDLIDKDKLNQSILNFPLRRTFQLVDVIEASDLKSTEDCYDPCFLLPLFSHLLAPENLVDCHNFLEHNCLGFVLAGLSSHSADIRGAAYHVLTRFYQQAEGSWFQEKVQVLYLLQAIRNSIETPSAKLAPIITVFLAKAAQLLLYPDDHMYQVINSYLLLKPSIDVTDVPEFYKLFNSSDMQYKMERRWMLRLLHDGLRETADYRIFDRRYIFKLLQSFHDSALSDDKTQVLALKIVSRACNINTVALDMARDRGITCWLSGVTNASKESLMKMSRVVQIIHNLWFSLLRDKDKEDNKANRPCLPPLFTCEILLLLQQWLRICRVHLNVEVLQTYLTTLISVLSHLNKTRTVITQTTGGSVPLCELTQTDLLLLLYHWNSLKKETDKCVQISKLLGSVDLKMDSQSTGLVKGVESGLTATASENSDWQNTLPSKMITVISNFLPEGNNSFFSSLDGLCYIIEWTLLNVRTCSENSTVLCSLLKWITQWLTDTQTLQDFVLSDDIDAKRIVTLLLGLYNTSRDMTSSDYPNDSTNDAPKEETCKIKNHLNAIFSCILKVGSSSDKFSKSKFVNVVRSEAYRTSSTIFADCDSTQTVETVSLLIQEIGLGAVTPLHSACMLNTK